MRTCWMTRLTVPCGSPTGSPSEMTITCAEHGFKTSVNGVLSVDALMAVESGKGLAHGEREQGTSTAIRSPQDVLQRQQWRPGSDGR